MSLIDKFGRKLLLYTGEITISRGEPLAQHSFLFELIHELKPLNSTVETSGYAEENIFQRMVSDVDLDIFAGEQEYDTKLLKPDALWERGVIFQNIGTLKKPKFEAIIINEDNPGWHDAKIGDVDGDGDIDIVSKVWKPDEIDFHLDFWENTTK